MSSKGAAAESVALATVETSSALATVHRLEFTPEQRQIIRDSFTNGATDAEFAVLMEVAKAKGLNPILGQIHFVKRYDSQKKRDVWSHQTAIDGFRMIAQRSGVYDGQDEPEYTYDGKRVVSAKVKVYRKDIGRPFVGEARFDEYVQTKRDGTPTKFWRTMPHVMLAKCAEAQAMRKAFPELLGDLYAPEEMAQASNANRSEGKVTTYDDPAPLAAAIDACNTEAHLRQVAARVKDAQLTSSDEQDLRDRYKARLQHIRTEQARQLTEGQKEEEAPPESSPRATDPAEREPGDDTDELGDYEGEG